MPLARGAVRASSLAALVLAAVLAPQAAATPEPPPATPASAWLDGPGPQGLAAHAGRSGRIDEGAVRRQLLAAAVHAGADRRMAAAALAPDDEGYAVVVGSDGVSGLGSMLMSMEDLDGNGTGDVADVRYAPRKDKGNDLALYVRDGATGRVVWQRRDVLPRGHFLFPVPAVVGAPARAGVLLVDFGMEQDGDRTVLTQTITALRGRDGKQLWRYRSSGELRSTESRFSGRDVYLAGRLPLAAGRAPELLLVAQEFEVDYDTGARRGAVTGLALSAVNGKVRSLVGRTSSEDSLPSLQSLPDLSGDGRDDLGLLVGGAGARVEARRGTDGGVLWTAKPTALPDGAGLWPAGAVTAGRVGGRVVQDVAVNVPAEPLPQVLTPLADVPLSPPHGQVILLSGATGTQVWSREGDRPVAVERAGSPLRPALAVATVDSSNGADGTTVTLKLVAHSAAGDVVYDRSYSVTAEQSGDPGFGIGFAYTFGDLQPDGAQDVVVVLVAFNGDAMKEKVAVVDGASGSEVPGADTPLGPSVTGRGTDLATATSGSAVQVTVRRGRDRALLFTRTLRPGATMESTYVWSEQLTSRCADVVVSSRGKTHEYVAVLSSTGAPRWSLLHKRASLAAGSVVRPRGPVPSRCR